MSNNDILNIEKQHFDKLMSYEFLLKKYKVWPAVRCELLLLLSKKKKQFLNPKKVIPLTKKINTILKKIPYIMKYNPYKKTKKVKALAFISTNSYVKEGDVYINRVYDYAFNIFEDQIISIESSTSVDSYLPRKYNNFKAYDIIRINEELYNLTFGRFDIIANRKMINEFCLYVGDSFDLTSTEISAFKRKIKNICGRLRAFVSQIDRLLNIYKPQMIFIHCAVYGDMNSYLINIAKKRDIRVIELQHGNISKDNVQYCILANNLSITRYIEYLPDEIGLLSEYYKQYVSLPVDTPILGFPHFSKEKEKNRFIASNENEINIESNILYVSQWVDNEFGISFIIELKKITNGLTIIYRPHPRENLSVFQKNKLKNANIIIGEENSIYHYLEKCKYIISIHSNVIFEALSYERTVFIINDVCSSSEIDQNIGIWINKPKDINDYLISKSIVRNDIGSFYPNDYKQRYLQHFKNYLIRER